MDLLALFADSHDTVDYKAGDSIFNEQQAGDVMYVVLQGMVELRMQDKLLDLVKPGQIFGELALIDAMQRSATAVAKQNCHLAWLDEDKFLELVHETPRFSLYVMKVLAQRLRKMNTLLYG
jgi:CRP/FNR family cyclic AMP-dependent transcriptional regulator